MDKRIEYVKVKEGVCEKCGGLADFYVPEVVRKAVKSGDAPQSLNCIEVCVNCGASQFCYNLAE